MPDSWSCDEATLAGPQVNVPVRTACPVEFHNDWSQVDFSNYDVFLSLKAVLILSNSADPDEMQHYAAFIMLHFI